MKNIVIFGYGYTGARLFLEIENKKDYKVLGFADNSIYKQGKVVGNTEIMSLEQLCCLKEKIDFSVIITGKKWYIIGEQLEKRNIPIEGIYSNGIIVEYNRMDFSKLDWSSEIKFYAGDICDETHMSEPNLFGLSINKADYKHIYHDITEKYPLPDNVISSYQAEDVLEHIAEEKVVDVINEIYRILRVGGVLRICLPDYYSPRLKKISMTDENGKIIFDPSGGGSYDENGVGNGGHLWFPNHKNVEKLLRQTLFNKIDFLCYHTEGEQLIRKDIDFSKGYINRIPKEKGKTIYSIVVDCYK